MFRTSVRSLKDPLREHVCFSCLAQGLGGRPRLRQFYSSPLSRAKSGDEQASDGNTHATSDEVFFFFVLALKPATPEDSLYS